MGKRSKIDSIAAHKADKACNIFSTLDASIMRTMLYFEMFRYPLTAEEVWRTCGVKIEEAGKVQQALGSLVKQGFLSHDGTYFWVGKGDGNVERRKKGNQLARKRLVKARKVSRFIGKFPYVKAVMISGSLSKNYMEADSDLDFFIVTRPGRLWVARSLLVLYKKIFLLNSHRNFCVNYFVDTDHKEIEDKNIFTATELVYLLPTLNSRLYEQLREDNRWADEFYPNFGPQNTEECHEELSVWWGRAIEKMLNGKWGERLDGWCMKRTLRRWESKFNHFDNRKFEVALRTRKYVSKHHPTDFQKKVVDGLAKKVAEFEQTHQVKLPY